MGSTGDSTPDQVSPMHSAHDRDSPSILELAAHGSHDPVRTGPQEGASVQYADSYTQHEPNENEDIMSMPDFSEFAHTSEALERLNFVIGNTFLRIGRIAEREEHRARIAEQHAMLDTLERSNTPSSVSEESNHSLPENYRQNSNEVEPPAKLRKVNAEGVPEADELDGETCPICLEAWGNSGDHKLVALKCGHLFGSKCVERWLKAQAAKDRSCPTCKSKAGLKDLRFIYARRLIAADTSQITNLQQQIEILRSEKCKTELELQKTKIAHHVCSTQLEVLKRSLLTTKNNREQANKRTWRFALEKNLEISKDGGCRVMTYNCRTYELYVSQKSANYLFPGYGIRKVSCVDYTLGQFVHLHPKPIRDIAYSQPKDLLLSVALDSTAKIVDRGVPSLTVNVGFPLWSCTWDYLHTNEFYIGGVGGVIHHYDVRNTSTALSTLMSAGDMSPVVSLHTTEYGLLSCQLNSCWLIEPKNGQFEHRQLPVEGSFMSLNYDTERHKILVAVRPNFAGSERSKLTVCGLKANLPSGDVSVEVEEVFHGSARSSLMSRATFVKAPGAYWVAAHSESDATLYLHGVNGTRTMSLPASEPALDVCAVNLNGNNLLAALSESRLRIYKAVSGSN